MFTSRCPSQCDNQSPNAFVFFSWSKYHLRDGGQRDPTSSLQDSDSTPHFYPNKRRKKEPTPFSPSLPPDFPSPFRIIQPRHSRVVSALGFSTAFCALPRVAKATLPSTEFEGRRSPVRSSRRAGEGGTTGDTVEPSSSTSISMAHAGRCGARGSGHAVIFH